MLQTFNFLSSHKKPEENETLHQKKKLRHYLEKIIRSYDNDSAGDR